MSINFQPKILTYFSENERKKIDSEVERRKKQLELSRDILAKNIILPALAKFQFAEYVEINNEGNVTYTDFRDFSETLFTEGWEFFRPLLPSPKIISKELKTCKINESEYENFLKEKFNGFCKDGLIEKKVTREEIDLEKWVSSINQSQVFGGIQQQVK